MSKVINTMQVSKHIVLKEFDEGPLVIASPTQSIVIYRNELNALARYTPIVKDLQEVLAKIEAMSQHYSSETVSAECYIELLERIGNVAREAVNR